MLYEKEIATCLSGGGMKGSFNMNIETVKTLWKPAPLDEKASARHWDGYAGSFAEKSLPTADDSLTLRIIKQQNLLPCGGRVLDVGCGTGRFSFALEAAGAEATGTDLSPKMIEKAAELKRRRNSGVELFNDDWSRVDLAARGWKGAFDLVLANMTPAICSADTFLKLAEASRGAVLMVKPTRRTNPILDQLRRLIGAEPETKALDETLAYAFNLAWFTGGQPQLAYEEQDWDMSLPFEEAVERYTLRLAAERPLSAEDTAAIRAYLENAAENGIVREIVHTTIAALWWRVRG